MTSCPARTHNLPTVLPSDPEPMIPMRRLFVFSSFIWAKAGKAIDAARRLIRERRAISIAGNLSNTFSTFALSKCRLRRGSSRCARRNTAPALAFALSPHHETAVHRDGLARHIARSVTAEPQNRIGNFLGTTDPPHRHVFLHGLES